MRSHPAYARMLGVLVLLFPAMACPAQEQGQKEPPSAKQVAEWKARAGEGDLDSACKFARCLREGAGVEKNLTESLSWYRKAADGGNPEGMVGLGDAYLKGNGVLQDHKAAAKWFRCAAEAGFVDGMFCLGHCYKFGVGVDGDPRTAFRWFKSAAELKHTHATRQVALWCMIGVGTPQDFAAALKWNQQGAELGEAHCMIGLAGQHLTGRGVEVSDEKANKWFDEAVKADGVHAMSKIAYDFKFGHGFLPKDAQAAIVWMQRAAEAGSETDPFSLGLTFERGEGVPVDDEKAMRWFKFGSDKGRLYCSLHYANGLWFGRGVKQDDHAAVDLFRKIAEATELEKSKSEYWSHGIYTDAMERLSSAYFLGKGAPKDRAMAYAWVNVAAGYGNGMAEYRRTSMEEFMGAAEIKEGQKLSREIVAKLNEVASYRK